MKIHDQIRTIRQSEQLSQEQLAQKLNVTRQAVYKWESGKGYPDIQNLIILSELFDISIDELIKGDNTFQRKIKVKGRTGMFSNRSLLSSLNYFSLFFAPVLFPLITLLAGTSTIKKHGKRALLSHLVPVLTYFPIMTVSYLSTNGGEVGELNAVLVISGMILLALITVAVVIWNIIQGIKQLKSAH